MPRNGSGTYSLPAGNPVVSGTTIQASWANSTLADISTELTGSLARSGAGGMLGALRGVDGTVSVPAFSFTSETTAGFYRAGTGDVRFAMAGADIYTVTSTGVGIGTSSPGAKLEVASGKILLSNTQSYAIKTSAGTSCDVVTLTSGNVLQLGGGGATDSVQFWNQGLERMRLDSSGNLGLGVTPSAWGGVVAMQLPTGASLTGFSNTTNLVQNAYYNGSWRYVSTAAAALSQVTQGAHQWFTAPSGTAGNAISFTQAMTLTNDGKLGIGTGSPSYRLDIVGPANTPHISSYDGNVQSVAAYPDGSGASARNYVGTLSNHDNVFLTNNVERGRFTTGGDFCVGATTVSGIGITLFNNVGPGFSLVNNNNAAATGYVFSSFRRSGVEIGSVTQNGTTAVLFNTTSDRRLKDNITPAPSASAVIDAIEIVSHDWKAAPDEHVAYGVIAQDLALVAPQAVLQGDDGEEVEKTWGVDYSKLVPMLIKEIQTLRARVAALEAA